MATTLLRNIGKLVWGDPASDADYAALHARFTPAEVMELGILAGMQIGSLKLAKIAGAG